MAIQTRFGGTFRNIGLSPERRVGASQSLTRQQLDAFCKEQARLHGDKVSISYTRKDADIVDREFLPDGTATEDRREEFKAEVSIYPKKPGVRELVGNIDMQFLNLLVRNGASVRNVETGEQFRRDPHDFIGSTVLYTP